MHHALRYNGGFESNFAELRAGQTTYFATNGAVRPLPVWPPGALGIRVGYMERTGKKFCVVRIEFEGHDVILQHPVGLDAARHLGNKRLSPAPTLINDELASYLLDDAIAANPEQATELALLINRVNQVRRGDGPVL